MTILPPSHLDKVVAIGQKQQNGQTKWCATGFLLGHLEKGSDENRQYSVWLVTNKHVLHEKKHIIVRFNMANSQKSKEYTIDLYIEPTKPIWFCHTDQNIDIALIQLNPEVLRKDGILFCYFQDDLETATLDDMNQKGLSEGDSIFVLGYPLGFVDQYKNFVFVRNGIISRIQDAYLHMRGSYIIDSSIYPGNSGGPVVSRPEIAAVAGTEACNQSLLIGVVNSYIPFDDVAISTQTQKPRVVFQENSGLANVIPVDYLTEIIEISRKCEERKHTDSETK